MRKLRSAILWRQAINSPVRFRLTGTHSAPFLGVSGSGEMVHMIPTAIKYELI